MLGIQQVAPLRIAGHDLLRVFMKAGREKIPPTRSCLWRMRASERTKKPRNACRRNGGRMSRSPTLPAPPCPCPEKKRLETILGVNQQIGVHGFHRVDIGFDIVRTDIQSVEPRPRLSGETETFDSPVMALIRVLLTNPISAIGGRRQGVCEIVIRLGCCLGAGASR